MDETTEFDRMSSSQEGPGYGAWSPDFPLQPKVRAPVAGKDPVFLDPEAPMPVIRVPDA